MPRESKVVIISSTARDLPEHRDKVMHACQRLGMFHPDMMENLTATDANALEVSLEMANTADIYVGVFAFRYGYVPDGKTISVTEAEYNRAVERKIPRLIFLMSDDHPVKPSDVETGEGADKLRRLKERLKTERVVGFFALQTILGASDSGSSSISRARSRRVSLPEIPLLKVSHVKVGCSLAEDTMAM